MSGSKPKKDMGSFGMYDFSGMKKDTPSPSRTETAVKPPKARRDDRNFARWLTEDEIKASLVPVDLAKGDPIPLGGVPLYTEGSVAYVDTSDAHTMIVGSTGSMKTRLFCMPLLQVLAMAGESAVVFDPKGELCNRMYGAFKSRGYKIHILDLRHPECSDRWNPLYVPYQKMRYGGKSGEDKALSMIKDMAFNLIPVKDKSDPFWESSAEGLFFSVAATLLRKARNVNEATMLNVCKLKNDAFADDTTKHRFLRKLDAGGPEYTAFSVAANNAENTCKCISSMFDRYLWSFVSSTALNGMLSGNDIDMASIGDAKTAVFIISPDEKRSMNSIASVFIKQLYETLIDRAESYPDGKLPVRVNLVLDEFANMPEVEDMDATVTACRSRQIRMFLVTQGMKQLVNIYGENAATIESNCSNLVFICGREEDYLQKLSTLAGKTSDGRDLITPFGLQRLDREKREAFVLRGRDLPFITHMTDIDDYGIEPGPKYKPRTRTAVRPAVFDSKIILGPDFDGLFD